MYKCEKCKRQIEKKIPQAKIRYYRKDGKISSEKKVCFDCKELKKGEENEKQKN